MHRSHTSEREVRDLRRPDRRVAMKVLVSKTFSFVDKLWENYVTLNQPNLRYIVYCQWLFADLSIGFTCHTCSEVEDEEEEEGEPDLGPGFDWRSDGLLLPLDPGGGHADSEEDEEDDVSATVVLLLFT